MDARLVELADRMDVVDTLTRYAWSIDRRDWAAYRSCFADEILLDFTSWGGGRSVGLFTAPKTVRADDWVAGVRRSMSGLASTHHMIGNHVVRLRGDEADCDAYVQAQHYLPNEYGDSTLTMGGRYENHLVRQGAAWRIDRLKLVVAWTTGNRFVFELAYARFSE